MKHKYRIEKLENGDWIAIDLTNNMVVAQCSTRARARDRLNWHKKQMENINV